MSEGDDAQAGGDGGTVKFTAGPQLWAYLQWLSRNTILGKSPGEVAQQILVRNPLR